MKEISINEYQDNIFDVVRKNNALLTAGSLSNYNAMTIGWLTAGILWGKNTLTCFVRPSRYTYKFIEENDYFTVSFFDPSFNSKLLYLGRVSGRDINKVDIASFRAVEAFKSVTFKEARLTFVCKKIYFQDMDKSLLLKEDIKKYYPDENNDEDFHRLYIGEIEKIFEREE